MKVEEFVNINLDYATSVNYAMQQNDVPIIRRLEIHNQSDLPFPNLTIGITTTPVIIAPISIRIESLLPEITVELQRDQIKTLLLRDCLSSKEEREKGELWVEIQASDNSCLLKKPFPLEVLAYNEWYGISSLPEILAAFVMPNQPAVESIVMRATQILRDGSGDAKIAGYQNKDRKRILTEIAALYDAIAETGIAYVNPQPSFEQTGQKIRTPLQIISSKLGTCLDLAVLMAAVLEYAGYASLLFVKKNHAFAGVWLQDTSFETAIISSGLTAKKRVDLGEMLVIETTSLTGTPPAGLRMSCQVADRHFLQISEFHFGLDIRMARRMGIRPISSGLETDNTDKFNLGQDTVSPIPSLPTPEMPFVPPIDDDFSSPTGQTQTRLERWKRKLLDLTRRNLLLNFRESLKSVHLLCKDIPSLEDALANGREFTLLPSPNVMSESDPRSANQHIEETGVDALNIFLMSQMKEGRIHTSHTQEELQKRLLEISRTDRVNLEESGANTVFLALGFLRWFEADESDIGNLAPIILIPLRIERRSVREGFRISMLDEESRINVTMLEKMKSDFGLDIPGLEPLPEDDFGLDIRLILHRVRDAVKNFERWDVVEDACISILTFNKFLMWQDLEYHVDLLQNNKIVKHLLETPEVPFPVSGSTPSSEELDQISKPSDVYCPLDADSSQLTAVLTAENGVSFVLQGPPGTGKSQTIANLIAHCMTKGKRVLFVSEKMAALNVVKKRLENVGIGPFCLELHSKKANKNDFRRQLDEVLQLERCIEPDEWGRKTGQMENDRKDLNEYVTALHSTRSFGHSAYWALSRMIDMREIPEAEGDFGQISQMTPEKADIVISQSRKLQAAAETTDVGPEHPLRELRISTWRLGLESTLIKTFDLLTAASDELEQAASVALDQLHLGSSKWSRYILGFGSDLCACLLDCPAIEPVLVLAKDWRGTRPALIELIEHGRKRDEIEEKLFKIYSSSILNLPLEQMLHDLSESRNNNFFMSWYHSFRARLILNKHMKIKQKIATELMIKHIQMAIELLSHKGKIEKSSVLGSLFGSHWNNSRPDWNSLQRQVEWLSRFKELLASTVTANPDETIRTQNFWSSFACEKRELLDAQAPLGRSFALFCEKMKTFKSIFDEVVSLVQPSPESLIISISEDDHLTTIRSSVNRWKEGFKELRAWCSYQISRREAVSLGLGTSINMIERGDSSPELFTRLCEKSFARWCLKEIFNEDQVFARFFGVEHDRKIVSFRELDDAIRDLTRLTVFAHLTKRLPRQTIENDRLKSSETGIIKRFVKGARISIRQMFRECPDALARLKPCVLMSPLSVAQYLGPDFPRFDIVVFDEASQMPPWDAIGAIARGDQLIVVGDSKQLPPTVFFEKAVSEDDAPAESKFYDLESILDECQACHLPVHSLRWHYRSRHESLISFSNEHYYYNDLLTFPSAGNKVDGLGVIMHEVPSGIYDASKNRTNKAEAEALVNEIVTRLKNPSQKNYSIGVVTFSVTQQRLIEDMLEDARQKNPDIDTYFTGNVAEPVFVKNLETVQGDERDVILFSICYGPNRDGKVDMRFGPLNNKGGERRLNVAITRARRQLIVFSTLRPDQIDLRRTNANGVRDLKDFLLFASRGGVLDRKSAMPGIKGSESPFEEEVRRMLTERGWEIDTQIGCSGYRIDLGVRHPAYKGYYVLGIECDGASYHSAKTARDRDHLRQAVLLSLGWRLIRVWSTDWWLNRNKEIERLDKEIKAAILAFNPELIAETGDMVNKTHDPVPSVALSTIATTFADSQLLREKILDLNGDGIPDLPSQTLYKRATLPDFSHRSEHFYEATSLRDISEEIENIMKTESPINVDLLVTRIAGTWALQRVKGKVMERVTAIAINSGFRILRTKDRQFFWRNDQNDCTYQGFRVPDPNDDFIRDADQIPQQEVANATHEMLKEHISLNREDLLKGLARLFGFSRIGARVRQAMEEGIDLYFERNAENNLTLHKKSQGD